MRYDVCVIGAGTEGLAAATILARAGLKVIAVEHRAESGGRCRTREFHPGFRAAPFADEMAPIPAALFWSLGLGRAGAMFAPAPASVALWRDRVQLFSRERLEALDRPFAQMQSTVLLRAQDEAQFGPQRVFGFLRRPDKSPPWPSLDLGTATLTEQLSKSIPDYDMRSHAVARALEGRSADPFMFGSALHLIAPGCGGSGTVVGGMDKLADALESVALAAGVEIRCGIDLADIRRKRDRVCGITLADGMDFTVGAIISTLDVKRTFLSFFKWNTLAGDVARAVSAYRFSGSTARLLIALDASSGHAALPEIARAPIHIAPDVQDFAFANASWRSGTIPDRLPMVTRMISASDPCLAPVGGATMTVTIGSTPYRLFDGPWTQEKRDLLRDRALAAIEDVLPGVKARIRAVEIITPPDIEQQIGVTEGDLWGGEIAADQMFDFRPGFATNAPRTPIRGLYLAGFSSSAGVLGTCASGAVAAYAILADRKARYLS